jgi:hypothetical protein
MPVKVAQVFRPKVAKPVTLEGRISFIPPPSLERLRTGALALSNPETVAQILRAAMAETLLQAYRKAFLQGLPGAVNMKREKVGKNVANAQIAQVLRRNLTRAYDQLQAARESGEIRRVAKAQNRLDAAKRAIRKALRRKRAVGLERRLSTGTFRTLALKILDLMTDTGEIQIVPADGSVLAGIGDLTYLEGIKTPSATDKLTGHPTASPRNVMWRQLEFGSGAWSAAPEAQDPTFRLPSGGWWYGRHPEEALRLRGTRPIGALAKLRRDQSARRFPKVLAELLSAELFGRS